MTTQVLMDQAIVRVEEDGSRDSHAWVGADSVLGLLGFSLGLIYQSKVGCPGDGLRHLFVTQAKIPSKKLPTV